MKKVNLVGLLALASCVVLSGCNDPKPVPVELALSEEIPAQLFMGDEIDLDEFVTLSGANDFTVTLDAESEAVATVDGHTIKANGEGEIKFTVSAGDKTAEGSFVAVSKIRAKLADTLDGVGYDYSFESYNSQGQLTSVVAHDENYVFTTGWAQNAFGGFCKTVSGKVWQYQCTSFDGANLSLDPEEIPSFAFDMYNLSLDVLDVEDLELVEEVDQLGEKSYFLSWKEDDTFAVSDFIMGTQMVSFDEKYSISILSLDIYMIEGVDEVTSEEYTYFQFGVYCEYPKYLEGATLPNPLPTNPEMTEGYMEVDYLVTGEDTYKIKALDDYIDAGNEPVTKDFSELTAALTAMTNGKNYTFTADYGWFDATVGGNPIANPGGTNTGSFAYYCGTGSESLVVTENQTYQVFKNAPTSACGLIANSGNVYEYSYMTAAADGVPSDGLYGVNQGQMDLWGNQSFFLYTAEFVSMASLWQDCFVSEKTTDTAGNITYKWCASSTPSLLLNVLNITLNNWRLASILSQNIGLIDYFYFTTTLCTNKDIKMHITMNWNTGMYYVMDLNFVNVGTSSIPSGVNVTLIAE